MPREFVFMDRAAIGLGGVFLHLGLSFATGRLPESLDRVLAVKTLNMSHIEKDEVLSLLSVTFAELDARFDGGFDPAASLPASLDDMRAHLHGYEDAGVDQVRPSEPLATVGVLATGASSGAGSALQPPASAPAAAEPAATPTATAAPMQTATTG